MKKRHLHRRFLAPQARSGNGHGYLTRPNRPLLGTEHPVDERATIAKIASATALCDEPEVISDGIVSYTETAVKAATLRHAAEVEQAHEARATMTPEQRVANAEARAKQQHVNVSSDLRFVRAAAARARAGGRRLPAGALRRLERVEALLDGAPLERLKRLAA